MAQVLGITLVKKFKYRDDPTEEWSNTYHFTGGIPADADAWLVQANALINEETLCYAASSKVVRAYGYDSDDDHAHSVWSHDYELDGSEQAGQIVTPAASTKMAGDQAGMVWQKTDRKNSRGKWVYLRKYLHDGYCDGTQVDLLHPNQIGYYQTFSDHLTQATIGELGQWRSRKTDDGVIENGCSSWVTTRTLHRRGKRPLPQP